MSRIILLLLSLAALPQTTTDTSFHIVSYAEVAVPSRERAIAAFKGYTDGSRRQEGFVRTDFFEQTGRSGHFLLIETWRDQKSYDARGAAIQQQLTDNLAPIRVSNYDQRPYKTMTSAPLKRAPNRQTVFVIAHVDVSMDPKVPGLLQRLAEASRKEDGNLRFDVLQHTMRANHFTVIEAWENEKARETHAISSHAKQYREELAPFLGSPLDERVYSAMGN
jgi:quinol monooxygenase YgiN